MGMGASDMMMMVWDSTVASHAQTWADTWAGSKHSDSSDRSGAYDGENMAQYAASSFVLTGNTNLNGSVQSWYDEIKAAGGYKNGGTFTGFDECSDTCGHFTQVVWASANALGCGVSACSLMGYDGYQLVCQYHASVSGTYGGNMKEQTLFTKGTACGECPSNYQSCTDSLCSDGTSGSTSDSTSASTSASTSDGTSYSTDDDVGGSTSDGTTSDSTATITNSTSASASSPSSSATTTSTDSTSTRAGTSTTGEKKEKEKEKSRAEEP